MMVNLAREKGVEVIEISSPEYKTKIYEGVAD